MKQQNEKTKQINNLMDHRLVSWGNFCVNGARTGAKSDTPLTQPGSLPVLIGALARARPGHKAPHLVSTLIEQCKRYEAFPRRDASFDPENDRSNRESGIGRRR